MPKWKKRDRILNETSFSKQILILLNLEEKQGRALSLAPLGYWYSDQRTDPLVIDFTEILKTKGAKN